MQTIDRTQFTNLMKTAHIKLRLIRELRFVPEAVTDWNNLEMLAVSNRSHTEGLLLIQTSAFYVLPYELITGLRDNTTERAKPITCDLCLTWQPGGNAGRITFRRASDDHAFTFLCCADLQCSLHVRDMTLAATRSRTQLHEDITPAQRVARLTRSVDTIIAQLVCQPTELVLSQNSALPASLKSYL